MKVQKQENQALQIQHYVSHKEGKTIKSFYCSKSL